MDNRIPFTEREDFKKFINEKINHVISKKPLCRIFIFGSYNPLKEKEFLIKIRDDLKKENYDKAWLVEDFPNIKDLTVRNKSIISLEYSHINFFIVTLNGEKGGFTVELEHIIHNASILSFKTVVFHEIKLKGNKEIDSLSQLHIGGLFSANIKFISFQKNDYNDLIQLIKAEAWRLHYHYVIYDKKY